VNPLFEGQPELLRRFRQGDREALAVVYRACIDDVYRLARYGFRTEQGVVPPLADDSAALDLVQETFVRAFAEAARMRFDGLRPYRPYLLRITRNLRIDQLRRVRNEPLTGYAWDAGGSDALELLGEPQAAPEERAHQQRLLDATAQYTAGLDAEGKRFVQLRFEEEGSQRDVAAAMGVTRRRVRSLESQVLSALARWLRDKKLR
jgi:RNA polymerase sigma factor (sigma-70 family)